MTIVTATAAPVVQQEGPSAAAPDYRESGRGLWRKPFPADFPLAGSRGLEARQAYYCP